MQTLEELDKEYREKRAALIRKKEIAATLPVEPWMVHFANKRNPWVTYRVDTLVDAVALSDQFTDKITYVSAKAMFRHVCPEELIEERYRLDPNYRAVEVADGTPYLWAGSSDSFRAMKLIFFVRRDAQIVRVCVDIACPPHSWLPRCICNSYDNVHRRVLQKVYPNVPGATVVRMSASGNATECYIVWGCDHDFRDALATLPSARQAKES